LLYTLHTYIRTTYIRSFKCLFIHSLVHTVTAQGPSLQPCRQGWKDITCISEYSKFRGCKYPGYPNGCLRTFVEPGLVIKVNCLLTLFIVIVANYNVLGQTACWNAVISVVSVPETSECSWCEQVYKEG
jgi:hypothetical protein